MKVAQAKKLIADIENRARFLDLYEFVKFYQHTYDTKITSGGNYHEVKTYETPIFIYNKKQKRLNSDEPDLPNDNPEENENGTSQGNNIKGNKNNSKDNISKKKNKLKYIKKSYSRRANKLRWYSKANMDSFNTFITLTFSNNKDYFQLVKSIGNANNIFDENEFQLLKSVTSIDNINNKKLRKKVFRFLSKHFNNKRSFKKDLIQEINMNYPNIGKYPFNRKLKRMTKRYLDSYIYTEDSHIYENVEKERINFIRRLKDYLDNNFSDHDLLYIGVISISENEQFHYHICLNLPKELKNKSFLQKMWKNGIADIKLINKYKDKKIIEYLNNNISKKKIKNNGKFIKMLDGKQLYFQSNNLKKPTISKSNLLNQILLEILNMSSPSYQKKYKAKGEYGYSFNLELYDSIPKDVYEDFRELMIAIIHEMISYAGNKGLEEIDQDVFEIVIDNYLAKEKAS